MPEFEDCVEMLSRETENRVEKNEFIKDEISVTLRQVTMSVVLYKRGVVELLRQHVLLSGGDRFVLRPRRGNVENLDRFHPSNETYFGEIHDTLRREVMGNENKAMF